MSKLLVISAEQSFRKKMSEFVSDLDLQTKESTTTQEGLKSLKEQRFDFVVLDSREKDLPCENLIRKISSKSAYSEILVAIDSSLDAEKLISCGVDETLMLPLEKEEVHLKIKRLFKERSFLESCGLVGKSEKLKKIAEAVLQVAPTNITVLITGESGTGKELIARAIHKNSPRKDKPFVAANCGALALGVLESELFGHEKGAFTGAVARREGLFERADQGTIFLDEVTEIPLSTQVKLLRVLEERNLLRVGGVEDVKVDVRVIAATNRDIEQAVKEGSFRSDLYYRLCVVKIDVPPLREREKDIPILVYDFVSKLNQQSPKKILGVSDEAMDLLLKYHWPGNVRELRNFLESMLVLSPDRMIERKDVEQYVEKEYQGIRQLPVVTGKSVETAEHELIYQALLSLRSEIISLRKILTGGKELPKEYNVELGDQWRKKVKFKKVEQNLTLEEMEKDLIERTLRETRGNRKKASKILGIGERTLYRKINKYGLREVR